MSRRYSPPRSQWLPSRHVAKARFAAAIDNVIKPILMSRAGNLSLLVVVLGVFGGAIAFVMLFTILVLFVLTFRMSAQWAERTDAVMNRQLRTIARLNAVPGVVSAA